MEGFGTNESEKAYSCDLEQNIGKEMADCFDKVVDKITKSSEDKCCYCKDTGFIPNNNTSEFDERPCVSCWVGQNIIKGMSPTEHPDVQRLIIQVETLSQENKRLEGEEKKKWEWVVHWKGKCVELQAENERLIELLKLAYRNWLEDPDVAWAELGEKLCDGLCESMGDKDYQEWMQALKGE